MSEPKGKKSRSRIMIMHAAKGLFEEKGLRNVTFNDIADRAEMCRTTIFNHFSTINELMIALADQEIDDLMKYCESTGFSGKKLIIAMFYKLIEDTTNYPALTATLTANGIINEQESKVIKKVEDIINDNAGERPPREKEMLTVELTGMYYGLVNHYFINNMEFDPKRMKRQFTIMADEILEDD